MVLPDRSVLIGQKLVENAKIENSHETFWVIFKQLVPQISEISGGERSGFYLILLLLYSVGCSSSIIKDQKKNFCRFGQFVVGSWM